MTMPDRIQITHQPRTMTTPRTALTSDDIPPGPLSEDDLRRGWNQQADEHNQWESLDSAEQLAWAQARAIAADRARAALDEPEGEGPSEKDLYDLAAEFNGDPVPAMRRALEVWGNPSASEKGEVEDVAQWLHAHALDCRVMGRNDWAEQCTRAATLLQQQCAPPATEPREAIQPTGRSGLTWEAAIHGLRDVLADQTEDAIQRAWQRSRIVTAMDLMAANTPTPSAPEPGEVGEVAQWLLSMRELAGEHNPEERRQFTRAATLLQQQEAELIALRQQPHPTFQDAIKLAQGCHDYSGGHSGAEGEAWHGAIDTVAAVLKRAAVGPWDSQLKAVYGVGSEAQAGEVALAGDRRSAESLQLAHESCRLFGTKNGYCSDSEICWLDMLPCSHYENCATGPAPQAGEVES
jgi:hypothetical protein